MINENFRYDLLAELYEKRHGEIAPGKDRPAAMGCLTDEERALNQVRWKEWLVNVAFGDLVQEIYDLRNPPEITDERTNLNHIRPEDRQ